MLTLAELDRAIVSALESRGLDNRYSIAVRIEHGEPDRFTWIVDVGAWNRKHQKNLSGGVRSTGKSSDAVLRQLTALLDAILESERFDESVAAASGGDAS